MTPSAIGIGWQLGVPSGWGTYGVNLALELARRGIAPKIFQVYAQMTMTPAQAAILAPYLERQPQNREIVRAEAPVHLPYPFLHPTADKLDATGPLSHIVGRPDIALTFFETAIIPKVNVDLAKRFAVIVTGSSWNAEILKRHGVANVVNCPQGVDLSLFAPRPKQGRFGERFVVFSGGKLEYRKGQDLVLAAFQKFQTKYPDALLVTAWHSPWTQLTETMKASPHLTHIPLVGANGKIDMAGWATANGIPASAFVDLGTLHNAEAPNILREADVALLPSRCEGGTNLVAMECMACGVPVILSRNTGHLDLIAPGNSYPLDLQIPIGAITGRKDMDGWGESSIDEIVRRLEEAYTDRAELARRSASAAQFMQSWSWPAQVGRFLEVVAPFMV